MSGAFLAVGATARVLRDCRGINPDTRMGLHYYRAGTKATLLRKTPHGWWCNFRDQGNVFGSFMFNHTRVYNPARGVDERVALSTAERFVSNGAMVAAR